jgi:hypothetical protein
MNLRMPTVFAALALSSCVTTGIDPNATIAAVQNAAIVACQFAPTAETVAALIAANNATVTTASAVAAAICAAVAPATAPTKLGAQLRLRLRTTGGAVVNGVMIQGRFVKI